MSWPLVKLKEVAKLEWGNTSITKASYVDEGFPAFSATGNDGFLSHAEFNEDGIILSAIGARCGKCFKAYGKWTAIKNTITIIPNSKKVDLNFLYIQLNDERSWKTSGAAQPFITLATARDRLISLPPLAEQQRIAELLDTADRILKLREQAIAKLDALAQSVFVDMFGDTTKNQKNWKIEKLSSLIKENDKINYGVIQPGSDYQNGVPLVRAGDVGNSNLNLFELKNIDPAIEVNYKRSRLNGDEILVSCVGLIGAVMLANKSMRGFNIARAVARISPSSKVNRIYLSEYLKSPKVQRYFINELRTVAQPTLNIKQICETEVICPPIALQNDFEKIINQFDLVRKDYKESLSKQLTFLRSLQHQSFAMN